ncbi:NnrU family protein [Algicella marina]|uniref:NnrU domain-containing protein n=1 Tax=Algicella marina TaxID=2683284 RepID=A0A6P1T2N8_9RHOB|nr:NnrU family protein [Algicella marina]QHQ36267.1 hypothetical protein GO499_14345 [Algicella marina]
MGLLIAGLLLWYAGHLFGRVAPEMRAGMTARMGEGSKGVFAGVLLLAVILMIAGFRGSYFYPIYTPPSWATHVNNLLMFVAVVLFGLGNSKGRARSWFRHPMLLGMFTWAVAHLMVNGDLMSVILFGGMLIWSVLEIALINRMQPEWQRPEPGAAKGDVRLLLISAVIYAVIAGVHTWLGYWPFGG